MRGAFRLNYRRYIIISVLKNDRNSSPSDYVFYFTRLYKYTQRMIGKIPKRKRRYLSEPILIQMNKIYDLIMKIHNDYYVYDIKLKTKPEQAKLITQMLFRLNKPLLMLWSIEHYETKRMLEWASMIDEEIRHIERISGLEPHIGNYMFILNYEIINKMKFLKNMQELHSMIHSKTISMPAFHRDTTGMLLINTVDEAFYRVLYANAILPKTKKEYEFREKNIDIAMNCLRELEAPSISMFDILGYNNRTMREWSKKVNYEMKLLNGLKKSDKELYGHLLLHYAEG